MFVCLFICFLFSLFVFLHQTQCSWGKIFSYACDIFKGRSLTGEYGIGRRDSSDDEYGTKKHRVVKRQSLALAIKEATFLTLVGFKDMVTKLLTGWSSMWSSGHSSGLFYLSCWCLYSSDMQLSLECLDGETLVPSETDSNINKGHGMTLVHLALCDL